MVRSYSTDFLKFMEIAFCEKGILQGRKDNWGRGEGSKMPCICEKSFFFDAFPFKCLFHNFFVSPILVNFYFICRMLNKSWDLVISKRS